MIHISIVNQSTVFPDGEMPVLANALQIQVNRDYAPLWGTPAQIYWTPTGAHPSADHWVVGIFDTSDQPGALGYHDVTVAGLPLGKVFAKTAIDNHASVSGVCSHELLEMLGDPSITLEARVDDGSGAPAKVHAYENCDPVEAEADGYDIVIPAGWGGAGQIIRVSDFVTPAWFELFNRTGPWDFMGHLKAPLSLNPGGYMSVLDEGNLAAGWQQIFGDHTSTRDRMLARPQPGSRRSRRSLRRSEWQVSTYSPGTEAHPAEGAIT